MSHNWMLNQNTMQAYNPNQGLNEAYRMMVPQLDDVLAGTEWKPTTALGHFRSFDGNASEPVAVMVPALTLAVGSRESAADSRFDAVDQVAQFVTSPGYRAMAQLWLGRDPQQLQLRAANHLSQPLRATQPFCQVLSFFAIKPARPEGYPGLESDRIEAHAQAVAHVAEHFRDTHVQVRCFRRYASDLIEGIKLEQAEIERRRLEMQRSQTEAARQMQAQWDSVLRESAQQYGYRPPNMLGSLIGNSQVAPPDSTGNSLKTWVANLVGTGKRLPGK